MRARDLIPTLLVVALAALGGCGVIPPPPPTLPELPCPAGTDGPQFACWLQEQP